ncbi:MAG: EamA family transporter, partial [Prevotellaceae bacterium]|nr:EamA family transporter [Prevotellaceae bacterium]
LLPFLLLKWLPVRRENRFSFRWTIPLIGVCLALADFVYFYALAEPDSLVAIVSALRRCSVVAPFLVGALCFREQNVRRKLAIICGMIAGVCMVVMGS